MISPSTIASASSGVIATFDELGLRLAVIDHRDFDQPGADVESDSRFLAAEERHVWLGEMPWRQ